jgi:hypothetical protein
MMRWLPPLLVLLLGCTHAEAPPEGLLDRAKFKQVLLQAQLVEARLNHEMVIDHRMDSPVRRYYADMFKEQGVTDDQFKRTFDHYTVHPEEMRSIYEEILTELDSLKERGRPQAPAVER